jgi:hypothetical protein
MLTASGCLSGSTRRASSAKSAKNLKASPTELSSRNQSLLGIYCAEIEAAADKIISESPSIAAQRQALAWKAEAIPAIQASLLNPDPLAAILDTWVFIFQMRTYMERPSIKHAFGEFYPVVTETINHMDAEMEQLIRAAAPAANVAGLRARVDTWAREHPIRAGLAGRQSVGPELIRIVGETDLRIRSLLQSVEERLGDITARLDVYNVYLPKQARWQAELLLSDISQDPQLEAAKSNLVSLSGALANTASRMDQLPEFMNQARIAVRSDVEAQRLAAQHFVRDERLETLDALHQERVGTVADLRNERLAATEDIRGERQAVFEALNNQEQAVIRDLNTTSEKVIQDFDTRSRRLIDHFFLRALELVLFTILLCSLLGWTLLRWFVSRYAERPAMKRAA